MKPERLQSAETIVNREQRRDEWAIRLVAWERTKGRRVAEKLWNVPQVADRRVGFNRMRIVKVKAVVKMVCVGRDEADQQQRTAKTRKEFLARDVRIGLRHRTSLRQ